jgi:hypothetical protein
VNRKNSCVNYKIPNLTNRSISSHMSSDMGGRLLLLRRQRRVVRADAPVAVSPLPGRSRVCGVVKLTHAIKNYANLLVMNVNKFWAFYNNKVLYIKVSQKRIFFSMCPFHLLIVGRRLVRRHQRARKSRSSR